MNILVTHDLVDIPSHVVSLLLAQVLLLVLVIIIAIPEKGREVVVVVVVVVFVFDYCGLRRSRQSTLDEN